MQIGQKVVYFNSFFVQAKSFAPKSLLIFPNFNDNFSVYARFIFKIAILNDASTLLIVNVKFNTSAILLYISLHRVSAQLYQSDYHHNTSE